MVSHNHNKHIVDLQEWPHLRIPFGLSRKKFKKTFQQQNLCMAILTFGPK